MLSSDLIKYYKNKEKSKGVTYTNQEAADELNAQLNSFKEKLETKLKNWFSINISRFLNAKYLIKLQALTAEISQIDQQLAKQVGDGVSELTGALATATAAVAPAAAALGAISILSGAIGRVVASVEARNQRIREKEFLTKSFHASLILEMLACYIRKAAAEQEEQTEPGNYIRKVFNNAAEELAKHVALAACVRFGLVVCHVREQSVITFSDFLFDCMQSNVFKDGIMRGIPHESFLRAAFPAEYSGDFTYSNRRLFGAGASYYHLLMNRNYETYAIAKIFYWGKRITLTLSESTGNECEQQMTVASVVAFESNRMKNGKNNGKNKEYLNDLPCVISSVVIGGEGKLKLELVEDRYSAEGQPVELDDDSLEKLLANKLVEKITQLFSFERDLKEANCLDRTVAINSVANLLTSSSSLNQASPELDVLNSDSDESNDGEDELKAKEKKLLELEGMFAQQRIHARQRLEKVRHRQVVQKIKASFGK